MADIVAALKAKSPTLEVHTPASADFDRLSALYIKGNPSRPLAIVRPRTEEEVRSVIAYACDTKLSVAIRAGGHDFHGRSGPEGALVIDMRGMNQVEIIEGGQAAVIGGGVLAQDLANDLAKTGHATTFGASSTVGWVGWATHGGYGPFEGQFGLGADQIIGARVVDCRGHVLDADEDMLYGIRGAGSAFGVIVSLKIKIYKLDKVFRAQQSTLLGYD
jgi:FAD/FMN-containing dehydrogenase